MNVNCILDWSSGAATILRMQFYVYGTHNCILDAATPVSTPLLPSVQPRSRRLERSS